MNTPEPSSYDPIDPDCPESSARSNESSPEEDLPHPERVEPELSEFEAKRQAALSSSFYHWVLSRL